jgi:hypothetical protein
VTPDEAVAAGYIGALHVVVAAGDSVRDGRVWLYEFGQDAPRAGMADWADVRLERLAEHGPEPDGWGIHPRADGATVYQLLIRTVVLPTLD